MKNINMEKLNLLIVTLLCSVGSLMIGICHNDNALILLNMGTILPTAYELYKIDSKS